MKTDELLRTDQNDAPAFLTMVRDHGPITLGEARKYAAALPPNKQKHPCCACYKCVCPTQDGVCCKGQCVSLSCNMALGGCLWYSCFLCACIDSAHPGSYSCSDMKGNDYNLVKVDADKGTWAFFSQNAVVGANNGDNQKVKCYCE